MERIRPPRLRPGDPVRVVAASGPVDRDRFETGAAVLAQRFDLRYDGATLFARRGFLAGDDDLRLRALREAIAEPDCRAVFLARGGYGLTRLLPAIDPSLLRSHPKPIVGYSDATALHAVCFQAGVVSILGPMVSDFGRLGTDDRDAFFRLLEDPDPGVLLTDLEELVPGRASGPLLGGNLEVLSRLLGTPAQPDFSGAILLLEEIGEQPYRLDRLLTHLAQAGVFAAVAGVVLGDFTDCDTCDGDRPDEPSARDVLVERLANLSIPVVLNGAFGHDTRKASLSHGARAELDTASGRLTAVEGAVS